MMFSCAEAKRSFQAMLQIFNITHLCICFYVCGRGFNMLNVLRMLSVTEIQFALPYFLTCRFLYFCSSQDGNVEGLGYLFFFFEIDDLHDVKTSLSQHVDMNFNCYKV
jgi:hypothetical protein